MKKPTVEIMVRAQTKSGHEVSMRRLCAVEEVESSWQPGVALAHAYQDCLENVTRACREMDVRHDEIETRRAREVALGREQSDSRGEVYNITSRSAPILFAQEEPPNRHDYPCFAVFINRPGDCVHTSGADVHVAALQGMLVHWCKHMPA